MKKNSLTVILIVIIILLVSYIIYDKLNVNKNITNLKEDEVKIIDEIELDYVHMYLSNEGYAYIVPLNEEEINDLEDGKNLKERLTTLYERAFYFDVYVNNYKIKGFRIKLDSDITKIRKIEINDIIYVAFIKENNTIGLFNYEDYYNLLNTEVIDNFNNLKNILDIEENTIIYLDGSKKLFNLEK